MPQKTRVGNYRSQSTTDVPRRRNRNEKLYKAGARSSVTLARKTLIEGPLFQKANWRYRPNSDGRVTPKQPYKESGYPGTAASTANAGNTRNRPITGSPHPRAAAAIAGS